TQPIPEPALPVVQVATPVAQSAKPAPADKWETEWSRKLGIKLLQEFDSSGEPAWDPSKHPLVFVTSLGPGYGGLLSTDVNLPGLTIIDANTYEVVASRQFDLGYQAHYEPHGLGVSPDGRWFYVPTADGKYDLSKGDTPGRWLVVDAKTLKLHQVIGTRSVPHHASSYVDADGNPRVLAYDFNWQISTNSIMRPGSGIYTFDPADNNRVVGGINADVLQANPYLAFASPDAQWIFVGLPPGPIGDPDVRHHLEGLFAQVDAKTWQPVKYYKMGYDPIWAAFSSDDQFVYLCDGGSDEVFKVDLQAQAVVGEARTGVHGAYGCHLGWDDTNLWTIEKGESSHNRGKNIGLVDVGVMSPVDNWNTGWIRADHGTVHPNPDRNELWVTANSSFEVVVWDMGNRTVKMRIPMPGGGSTHSGAFVEYRPDFTGVVLADQSGLHGKALQAKRDLLGVTVSASETTSTSAEGQAKPSTVMSQPEPATVEVEMGETYFKPNQISVQVGQEVTFHGKNVGVVGHQMVVYPLTGTTVLAGNQDLIAPKEDVTFTWKPDKPGTYRLVCNLHPGMQGLITVK
ncbi:MAG TPA: hypothetical protein DEP84_34620, partial [Chloroflexi bacterium]|nr:hypothetical protein [Chloroflexota bacterium]